MPVFGSLNSLSSESPRLKFTSFYVTKHPLQLTVSALHLALQQYQQNRRYRLMAENQTAGQLLRNLPVLSGN